MNQFIPPLIDARQYLANGFRNMRQFLARDFHADSGMHFLVSAFYRSIENGEPLPIPYRDIILTARIMDEIFSQIRGGATPPPGFGAPLKSEIASIKIDRPAPLAR